jgi:enoyl-CoA hydratase/carnithine racemase
LGIIPDMAITATLRASMPIDKVKELALSGRVIDGNEAEKIGLVTSLHDDPLSEAHSLAQEIAGRSPDAIRAIKELVDTSWQLQPAAEIRLDCRLETGAQKQCRPTVPYLQ